MFGASPLPDVIVAGVLADSWHLDVAVEYQPIGYGSYHWLATERDGHRWFVTADNHLATMPVVSAYEVARQLADTGLDFVRAPLPTVSGKVTHSIPDWWISVWPWVDGRKTSDAEDSHAADLAATLSVVRRLHDHQGVASSADLVEDWSIDCRDDLVGLLAGTLDWEHGPYVAEVHQRLQANEARYEKCLPATTSYQCRSPPPRPSSS